MKVLLISFPTGAQNIASIFINDIIEILKPNSEKIIVLTNISTIKTEILKNNLVLKQLKIGLHKKNNNTYPYFFGNFFQLLKIVMSQIEISGQIFKMRKDVDIIFFYLGGGDLIFPVIVSKLLRKKIIYTMIGSFSSSTSYQQKKSIGLFKLLLSKTYLILENICYFLSDRIVIESPSVEKFHALSKYKDKTSTSGARFIDVEKFRIIKPYIQRENIIGFLGRLSEEKGIINLISALPILLKKTDDISFVIAGEGHLKKGILDIVKTNNLERKVTLIDWLDHNDVPFFLNQLKLLIIPSYSEGLPTVLLEAMACGTPVLATRVGGIPDLVTEGKTGFLLENNSPQTIAKTVLNVLKVNNLEEISNNAKKSVDDKFTFQQAVKIYEDILNRINFN